MTYHCALQMLRLVRQQVLPLVLQQDLPLGRPLGLQLMLQLVLLQLRQPMLPLTLQPGPQQEHALTSRSRITICTLYLALHVAA